MMRAVAYLKPLPIEDAESLVDIEVDRPSPSGKDLLVEVTAVSVNPVDRERRRGAAGPSLSPEGGGLFRGRGGPPRTAAESDPVDERIVGRKPSSLGFPEAAAL